MGGGIDQPGGVIDEHQAQGDAPEHQGPAAGTGDGADPEQQAGQGELQGQEPVVQPAVVGIGGEITREPGHGSHGRDLLEHPAHVAPPEATVAVVMIRIRIGKLVVVTVQTRPVDRAVLAAEGATGGEEALQPLGHAEGPMAEQPVVADRHAQAGGDPVENHQRGHGGHAPEARQQGHQGQNVDRRHEADGDPAAATRNFRRGLTAAGATQPGGALQGIHRGDGRRLMAAQTGSRGGSRGDRRTCSCGGHNGPAPDQSIRW